MGTIILQSCTLGILVATLFCIIMLIKHKPVKEAKNADYYLNVNSLDITNRYDKFVDYKIDKKIK